MSTLRSQPPKTAGGNQDGTYQICRTVHYSLLYPSLRCAAERESRAESEFALRRYSAISPPPPPNKTRLGQSSAHPELPQRSPTSPSAPGEHKLSRGGGTVWAQSHHPPQGQTVTEHWQHRVGTSGAILLMGRVGCGAIGANANTSIVPKGLQAPHQSERETHPAGTAHTFRIQVALIGPFPLLRSAALHSDIACMQCHQLCRESPLSGAQPSLAAVGTQP